MNRRHASILMSLTLGTISIFFGWIFYSIYTDPSSIQRSIWSAIEKSPTIKTPVESIPIQKQMRYMNLALQSQKEEWCTKIQDIRLRKMCHESYIRIHTIKQGNIETCNSLQKLNEQTLCIDTVNNKEALEKTDISICNTIKNVNIHHSCVSSIEQTQYTKSRNGNIVSIIPCIGFSRETLENCKKGNMQANDSSILRSAKIQKNITLCEKLTNSKKLNQCKNEVNYLLAIQEKSMIFCKSIIDDDYLRNACSLRIQ